MDLEGDKSGPDAVPESVAGGGIGNDVDNSGKCVDERVEDQVVSSNVNVEVNETAQTSCSPGANSASPGVSGGSAPKKGYGLKKWKRIRRVDVITNVSNSSDAGKVPKRGLPISSNQLAKDTQATANLLEKNLGGSDYFPAQASSSIASAMGALSDNSEDQSSKSSTAASAPRLGFDMPSVSPFSWDKSMPKNLIGKGLDNPTQRGQLGRVLADPSKKFRGRERVKYEKENSHSSLESDSRSSNFVFMQASNGRLSKASLNFNGESDEDIPGEHQFTDDQAASIEANVRGAEDILSLEAHKENGGNHQQSARRDPLVDSVLTLNSVQEALEKELLKFREMGRESYFTSADVDSSVNSSDYMNHEESTQNASGSLDIEEKIRQLEEARNALRVKGSQISRLEATLNSKSLHKGDAKSKAQEEGETERLETELELLFEQYIEADIKNLATLSALQDPQHVAVNPTRILLAEQKALVDEQSQLLNRFKQTECEAVKTERQAKTYSEGIGETGEARSLQKSIKKLTWYSLFQMLMLLWFVYSQLVTDPGAVVPT